MSLLPNTVVNGNCLEVMKEIDDASIDMILCDLPYGATQNSWDSVIPPAPLWEQYERIIILEPFKRLTIFEPVEKDGETTEKKVTVGIIYRSDGLYAWDNSRAVPNEYDEAIKWSPASQLPEYAIRRKAIVTKFEYKPLRSFTADDIKLLRLDYASQDDPQLLMEEYLPIKNFELLYGWWKQHYKATLKDCDNPQAIILHLASTD